MEFGKGGAVYPGQMVVKRLYKAAFAGMVIAPRRKIRGFFFMNALHGRPVRQSKGIERCRGLSKGEAFITAA